MMRIECQIKDNFYAEKGERQRIKGSAKRQEKRTLRKKEEVREQQLKGEKKTET